MQPRDDNDKIPNDPHIGEKGMSQAEICNLNYVGLVAREGLGK
jgi:hypothetical protein